MKPLLAARDDGEAKGPLSIGSMETTAAVRPPALLSGFHRRFPAVTLEPAHGDDRPDPVTGVLDGTLDGAFVAGPIHHAELTGVSRLYRELVLIAARRFDSLAALRAGTPQSGPDRAGVPGRMHHRHRLEQLLATLGWPSAARCELGTLDGMIGCVAADMGVAPPPRAVIERSELAK